MTEKTAKQYLQVVYVLQQEGSVRAVQVAREMEISKPTVSVAMRQLVEDGYLLREADRSYRLTGKGSSLARVAIHETIARGRNYHGLMGGAEAELSPSPAEENADEQRAQWLRQEKAEALLEAIYILSRCYYYVRPVDAAHFLKKSAAQLKKSLTRLEMNGFLTVGEHEAIVLSDTGITLAKQLYDAHEPARRRMVEAGISEETAEAETCRSEEKRPG